MATLAPARAIAAGAGERTPAITSWDELAGCTVALITGAPFEGTVREKCPEVGEVVYYTTTADTIAALQAGKIDAFVNSMAVSSLAVNRYSDLALLPKFSAITR